MAIEALGPEMENLLVLYCMEGTPSELWHGTTSIGLKSSAKGVQTESLRLPEGTFTAQVLITENDGIKSLSVKLNPGEEERTLDLGLTEVLMAHAVLKKVSRGIARRQPTTVTTAK
jgi:hypothetical protein